MNCEININECESNPCLNGAKCTDLENKYECKCLDGFQAWKFDDTESKLEMEM